MNRLKLKELIKQNEGERRQGDRHVLYRCPTDKQTIGWGRNIQDRGISNAEAEYLLDNDVDDALTDLNRIFPNFFLLPQAVQIVLADMRFNLGPGRFRSFKKMIAAIRKEDWAGMKREMMDSKWFREDVGLRGPRLVTILDGGEEWYADA